MNTQSRYLIVRKTSSSRRGSRNRQPPRTEPRFFLCPVLPFDLKNPRQPPPELFTIPQTHQRLEHSIPPSWPLQCVRSSPAAAVAASHHGPPPSPSPRLPSGASPAPMATRKPKPSSSPSLASPRKLSSELFPFPSSLVGNSTEVLTKV